MVKLLIIMAVVFIIIPAFLSLAFVISSIWERENRAVIYGGLTLSGMLGFTVLFVHLVRVDFFNTLAGLLILIAWLMSAGYGWYLLLRKTGTNTRALDGSKGLITGEVERPDERETVFARNMHLQPGTDRYEEFYGGHPELKEVDDLRRKQGSFFPVPGVIDKPHQGPNMAASMAHLLFQLWLSGPDKIRPGSITGTKTEMSPTQATTRVKGYAEHLGADLVGVCKINPLWVYSHRGIDAAKWGKEIEVDHKYAIVVAVEMNHQMVRTAPHTPSLIESMHKYSDGVFISVQLASYIANLGYSAAANHVHHYDAPLVPLAVDAGLGELSRMGYLITKEYGPRVRLAAVTTDLPLVPDKPVDIGVWDFCEICEKCVDCCPSKSIPSGPPQEVNGTLRWKLNAETCFEYWGNIGSDCCICMRVCPWSHPRTFPHKIISELCARNSLSRRIFFKMDNIFYGKRPGSKPPPDWAGFKLDLK